MSSAAPTLLPPAVESMLSPLGRGLVEELFDEGLRVRVVAGLDECARALSAIDALRLDAYEVFERDAQDLSVWTEVSPLVRDMLMALRRVVERLGELFPHRAPSEPASFELNLEFPPSEPAPGPSWTRDGARLDQLVAEGGTTSITTDLAVASLIAMLKEDLLMIAQVLRDPRVVSSRFRLLAELEEWKARAQQCIEALAAAMLRPIGDHRLSDLLPRYVTELDRSVRLREGLRALEAGLGALRVEAQAPGVDLVELLARADASVRLFREGPAYRTLWARDRREILILGAELGRARDASEGRRPVDRLEALLRFVSVLIDAVSRRPELETYDRENEELALMLGDHAAL